MTTEELRTLWKCEEQQAFKGWDFSYLDGRWSTLSLPWDYQKIVLDYLSPSQKLLDIGTGGGEFLLGLNHPYNNTCVTESWMPNVRLCRERLEPLGIGVYQVFDGAELPFDDNAFDIVINRHASYNLSEVSRILKPGGLFITQQVGSENNKLLSKRLCPGHEPPFPDFYLPAELPKFEASGFTILHKDEAFPETRFVDVGAVVYYAKVIEWEYPHFSVDNNFPQLCDLYGECTRTGYIASREHRFIIAARNAQ